MKMIELMKGVEFELLSGSMDRSVLGMAFDSRKVGKDYLFVAIDGFKQKGSSFASDAIRRGAAMIVLGKDAHSSDHPGATVTRVKDTRRALSKISANFFGNPSADMVTIGVTGTNGKTTITYLLESIFTRALLKTCVLGTINYRGAGTVEEARRTTPESLEIQEFLSRMKNTGVTHAIMEASSHAMSLKRLDDILFDLCIFTNITQDHLDFHRTIGEYKKAKMILFEKILNGSPKKRKFAVLNCEDPFSEEIETSLKVPVVRYGFLKTAEVRPLSYELSEKCTRATLETQDGNIDICSSLVGRFNLSNIMAAVSSAIALGIPKDAVAEGIENLKVVPGRLEKIENDRQLNIYVDYAHTDDALTNVISTLNGIKTGRIITVFGCGGDRDKGKRPKMGKVATDLSDITIITSDNPRSEDPELIIGEILDGVDKNRIGRLQPSEKMDADIGKSYAVVPDRKEALRFALKIALPGDSILVAGKGHEDYQEFATGKVHFSDKEFLSELVND